MSTQTGQYPNCQQLVVQPFTDLTLNRLYSIHIVKENRADLNRSWQSIVRKAEKVSVKVIIPQFLRPFAEGVDVTDVEGSTVGDCLNELIGRFPRIKKFLFDKSGELLKGVEVYVNGKSSYPDELAYPVNEGDELYMLLIISGG